MEEDNFYDGVTPDNYEQKCPVVFVLDRSVSMRDNPIKELNRGLQEFQTQIQNDPVAASRLDVCVISFGSDSTVERDFDLIGESPMPTIQVSGSTAMVSGLKEGIKRIQERKNWYKNSGQTYYRPYLILITDGAPNNPGLIPEMAKEIRQLAEAKSLSFWPIAVAGANMEILEQLACPNIKGCMPPLKLIGLKFIELFKWLSSSFTKVSNSKDGEGIDITPDKDDNPFQFTID